MLFERLKFGVSALIGLLIGLALAFPLFWLGVKKSVGAMHHSAQLSFEQVEKRQQAMADECLRLEKILHRLNYKKDGADFSKVELLRSRLAGEGDFEDKIELSQDLERALLNVERVAQNACERSWVVRKNVYVRQYFLDWDPLKRYLVEEEIRFSSSVKYYNRVLGTWPVPAIIGHRSFGSLLKALVGGLVHRSAAYVQQGWILLKFAGKWLWALATGNLKPSSPPAMVHYSIFENPLFEPLPQPYYIAQAPLPEEDYKEIQFDREMTDMADIESGEEKAVRENAAATPFALPLPTVQKTATY